MRSLWLLFLCVGCGGEAPSATTPAAGVPVERVDGGALVKAPAPSEATPNVDLVASIHVVAPTERDVTPTARTKLFDELARIVETAKQQQTAAGPRVFGVSPENAAGKLGLENGDVIVGFGDKPPTHEGLEAFRGAQSFVIRVQRRGAPLELVVHMR